MSKLSASLEDYLEIIYNYESLNKQIRAIDIAKQLNISRASVSEALKKRAIKGFINYGHYDAISLTCIGKEVSKEIASKHNTLKNFFINVLELTEEEASENACKIEHVITDGAFKKITELVNRL